MPEQWFRDYIQLQFRMDWHIRKFTESRFVDFYYGPPEWKAAVESEAETPAPDLVRASMALLDTLPAQGFEARRANYLSKQLVALETVCRKLSGETFTLEDEVQRCFDIRPEWTPETRFEEAHALFEVALPGEGSLYEHMEALRTRFEVARDKAALLPGLMRLAMDEARRRTRAFLDMPPQEEVEMETVSDKLYGGENWYLGNYRSHVDVNTDLPLTINSLIDLVCHEGYPGHHTEFVLKERLLYRELGYIEESIAPIIGPRSVVSEGIATSAFETIFTHAEAEQWAEEHLYPAAGITPVSYDMEKLARARELMSGIFGNARFMLSEGRPENEVIRYLVKYSLYPEEYEQKEVDFMKDPFREGYIFTYAYGKQLLKPWLAGPDRQQVFKRLLTEQLCPS
ncbi:MAG TPA: hypothetical protein VGT44_12935, partial [Ktedonobacteraceae bacterium]|nr:hypothetical protein [Ktedonobacteraceae bacterium]